MKKQNPRNRQEEVSSEFEEKVIHINRNTKVVSGGRKFSFSALVLVGDRKGRFGIGFAKANEVADAIRKGGESARKKIQTFEMNGDTIPHEIKVKHDGSTVFLKPAPTGTGIIAGSNVRAVLELGGVKDVVAKIYGSNNPLNQVRAIMKALSSLKNRHEVLAARGIENL
jgi:small subunit ribosomal protein S5